MGKNAIPVQIPIGQEDDFVGLVDLFEMEAYYYKDDKGEDIEITEIPDDLKDLAQEWHENLVEKICDLDDDLMMQYLEGEEPSVEDLKKALRKGTIACEAVPVYCGSAYKNKGVQKMLDGVIEYMPAPTDIPDITGTDEDGNEVVRKSSDDEPFAALAFKIMTDPFVGKLAFFRVYSGTLNSGSYVLNATKGKKERVGRILQMHANKRSELDKVYSGDIAAAVGFKLTTTGDTICDEKHPVVLESMEFPEPVIELAIEPKTKNDQGKMGEALAKLAEEDPTFRAHTDQETGQTIIAGMGELHLEVIVDRLLREFNVESKSIRSTQNSLVVVVSMVTVVFVSHRWIQTARTLTNSSLQSLVVLFRRNTFRLSTKVFRKLLRQVSLPDSRYSVFMRTVMMVLTMKSIRVKWHSTSLVPWHSKML